MGHGALSQLKNSTAALAILAAASVVQAQPTNLTPTAAPATSSLATTLQSAGKSKSTGVVEAGWSMSLGGTSFSDEKEQAQIAGLEIGGRLRYALLETLEMKADAGFNMESGYAQSRFGDNTPKSGLDLREAFVQFKPLQAISLQAGAINQAHLNSPLLVSAQAFPAVLEKLTLGSTKASVELKAQQAIPTSSTLSTKAVEAEQTPSFMTESLTAKALITDRWQVSAFGLHYAFHQLPSTVAEESELYGNTVTQVSAKTDRFTYEFDGFSYGGGTRIQFAPHAVWSFDGQILTNSKAPESYNQGQILSSGFEFGLANDVDLKPKGELFFAESDVAPGFYNGSDRGHNNRTGWAADLGVVFKKAGFAVGGRFAQADLINASTVQTKQSFFMLRFETLYALF